MTEHPSRFTLALRSAGDLPAGERDSVDAHVATCPECGAVVSEIENDRADYESRAGAERERLMAALADAPRELGTARGSRRPLRIGLAAAVLAAAAVVALVVVAPGGGGEVRDGAGDIAFKGGLAAQVVAKRGSHQFAVRPGDALEAGDALRFVVTVPEAGYVAVLSIEASGRTSVFYPSRPAAADAPWPVRIESPGRHEMPESIILDDAPGAETYVVIFSQAPFSRDVAVRAASALAAGQGGVPGGIEGRALRVRKVVQGGR